MENLNKVYDAKFFADIETGSRRSAKTIIPFIQKLIPIKSVVDVGCGTGEWLSVFQEVGVDRILGIDGDYVDKRKLKIKPENFLAADLSKPLDVDGDFDLAMSVEVAEHLPPSSAQRFVDNLTSLSPIVLFSAAIPHQDGVNHINEQWPLYWIKKFEENGYGVIDNIRLQFWENEDVAWWYKQNLLLFIRLSVISNYPNLTSIFVNGCIPPRLVHPELLIHHVQKSNSKLAKIALTIDGFLRRNFLKNG